MRRIEPNPWLSLACCQKALNQQSISKEDGMTLAALVRENPEDTKEQRDARFRLFDWLYARLEPQAPALPLS